MNENFIYFFFLCPAIHASLLTAIKFVYHVFELRTFGLLWAVLKDSLSEKMRPKVAKIKEISLKTG